REGNIVGVNRRQTWGWNPDLVAPLSRPGRRPMTKFLGAMVVASFALLSAAMAQGTCESRAVDKNGKALVGAAKTSFLQKCRREACEPKAVDKNGKALTGAAKKSFLQKCEREA